MGLLKTAAKVAVASHVHGQVKRRQSQRWAAQDAAAATAVPVQSVPVQPVPPHSAAAPSAPSTEVMLDQLARLGDLRAAGVLTEAEFEAQKARILGQ